MAPLLDSNNNDSNDHTDGYTIDVEEQDATDGSSSPATRRTSYPLSSLEITDDSDHLYQELSDDAQHTATTSTNGATTSLVATAIEREQQQRKTLVEQMIRLLFLALEKKKLKTHEPSSKQKEITEMILKEEAGTFEFATKPRSDIVVSSTNMSVATTTRTVWNKGQPLKLYWMWQKFSTENRENTIEHSVCKLGIAAENGVVVKFSHPTSLVSALLSADEDSSDDDTRAAAVCEISNFEWRLKGSTKHSYVTIDFDDDIEDDDNRRTEDYIVKSSWKLDRVGFSMVTESMGFATEEVLMEAKDVTLRGSIVIDSALQSKTAEENAVQVATTGLPSLQLRENRSALSLTVLSTGSFDGSAEERRRVGMLLRTLVDSLDQLLAVPKLQLSVEKLDDGDERHHSPERDDEPETSFHENGLGDALKHVLRRHCNDDSGEAKQQQHRQHLRRLQQQSPQLFTSSKGFGAMVSRASQKAKERAAKASEKRKEQRRQFGENARGLVGSFLSTSSHHGSSFLSARSMH
mmetsp:Transcript_15864/g.36725  ORF Transcript_15864/g.36725 Transcript_15864/m.36725 type:complete len:521 (+) Transcript_15864:108-1670(+)|eukprot:CAMPEP_0197188076 /NCGR_PEP_ID=MMETSP1423-20130617/17164_1 /TAXON_ID=476441 /ORGANISM="Pseudo-nitzschia heimii, Strain UNC1101" /LENGTH=520 /DNA_ID=CAMNT_0042639827 /DNA_START=53 /DNA_END=1618 /DNA_ORIENTATION=+